MIELQISPVIDPNSVESLGRSRAAEGRGRSLEAGG